MLIYFILFVALIYTLGPYFIQNITWLLRPEAANYIFQGRWDLVFLYIFLFSVFSFFLFHQPAQRGTWKKSSSVYIAFIIALFAEMFGFPLTAYFLSSTIPVPKISDQPAVAFNFTFNGVAYNLLLTSFVAGILSVIGFALIVLGWKRIYKARGLVTNGIYKYIRHPQYLGILIIMTAWLFAWPTILTMIMWPILTYAYYRLAKKEEKFMIERFGKRYINYADQTPRFLPFSNA